MDSKILLEYCLRKEGAFEDYPFGPEVIVVKVACKMFALLSGAAGENVVSLKCDPAYAELLRQHYASITPGYHLNKRHWNTLRLNGSIPEQEVQQLVDHSYNLVTKSLTKAERSKINSRDL